MTDFVPRGHTLKVTNASTLGASLGTPVDVAGATTGSPIPSELLEGNRTSRTTLRPLELPSEESRAESTARSFRAMYEGNVDFVWRSLRRLGVSEANVEDRTQEVFVVAHRRFDTFEDRGHGPRAWLFQIVLRVANEARRHRRRHPEDPDGDNAMARAIVDPTQQEAVLRREQLSRLDAALETIDVGRRAVLVLHEIEEMTAPEVAQVLGIPLNTVYSRLRVARMELEQALRRQENGR